MAKEEGGSWAPVCRQLYEGATAYPTTISGDYICQRMNYSRVVELSNLTIGYSFAEDYKYKNKVYNLKCSSSTECTYDTSSSCRNYQYTDHIYPFQYRYYYTEISCTGCKANTYSFYDSINYAKKCLPCPAGAASPPDSTKCNCAANWFMTSNYQHCFKCPTNSSSPVGSTHCYKKSGQDRLEFQIWSERNVQSDEGVLVAKEEGGSWAPVCRQKSFGSSLYPTLDSADYICQRMNYSRVVQVSKLYADYSFAENYTSNNKVYNLNCSSLTECTYDRSSSCRSYQYRYSLLNHNDNRYYYRYYYTKISCKDCRAGYYSYSGATECFKCPGNLTSNKFQSFCTCLPGSYWRMEERNCVQCPEDHYTTDSGNNIQCTPCPQHSTSTPGSTTCSCKPGYILVNNTCHQNLTYKIVVAAFIALLTIACLLIAAAIFYRIRIHSMYEEEGTCSLISSHEIE